MDIAPEREDLFNEVYDTEHIPALNKVRGVISTARFRSEPFKLQIGGETKNMEASTPLYVAMYELRSPDVLTSPEWKAAVESGRWPSAVRPFTKDRRHTVLKKI